MVWCNEWSPENFPREESGRTKVGVGDPKLHFHVFRFFCVWNQIFALCSAVLYSFHCFRHRVWIAIRGLTFWFCWIFTFSCPWVWFLGWLWFSCLVANPCMHTSDLFVVSFFGLGSFLQARRTETMVDGLRCAASYSFRRHKRQYFIKFSIFEIFRFNGAPSWSTSAASLQIRFVMSLQATCCAR